MSEMKPFRVLRYGKTLIYREVRSEPFPHIVLDRGKPLQGWYKNASDRIRPRPCFTEAVLTQPYGGFCPVNCMFCYVNMGIRGYRSTKHITIAPSYTDQIRKQISRWYVAASFYITSFHEPFNMLEDVYHLTKQTAALATNLGLPVFFLSRLLYPEWAKELLTINPYSYAQKSINTSSELIHRRLSPGGPSLADHYRDISDLARRGVYVSIQVNPVFLGVVDPDDILTLIRQLARYGANHVIVKFVEVSLVNWRLLLDTVKARFGNEAMQRTENTLTEIQATHRTVPEQVRRQLHQLFMNEATRCGITYALCYEYDRSGQVSLGREYCTADQCHGKRVPVFYRTNLNQTFRPFEDCEPSGCLYCREKPCRHPALTQAKAMRDRDYRIPIPSNSAGVCSTP